MQPPSTSETSKNAVTVILLIIMSIIALTMAMISETKNMNRPDVLKKLCTLELKQTTSYRDSIQFLQSDVGKKCIQFLPRK